jgi:hypothetical protein
MLVEGSCHCGAVSFRVQSPHPYPFNLCYCTICRKTAGGGGFAINLGGEFATLEVAGRDNISVYRARIEDAENGVVTDSPGERSFCKLCGSALWMWDPRWPELVHPLASAIDTELPRPPERTHLMLEFKASWVDTRHDPHDRLFQGYPDESIAAWHERLGLADGD